MKKVGSDKRINRSLFSMRSYFSFFILISFIVTCCMLLFLNYSGIEFENVYKSAIITFGNVLFLSLICCIIDGIRHKITMERPVKRILNATHKLAEGDFTAKIEPFHGFDSMNEFDAIIQDFNKMAKELSGIETLRADFIANVSHELKTPLSVIQNYATILQNPHLTEEKRTEYAKIITDASRRLSELITNILKLNKLENQQIFSETKKFDLGEQVRECLLGFEDAWEKKNLDLEIDIDDIIIKADSELTSLVWNNLFSNAIKFSQSDGKITVTLKEENDWAVVRVADTGCGMSAEVGQNIFEKFYQGDKSHACQGNGLGLALVKRVVDIVGGEISVESAVGKGSTFTIKLRREEE